MIWQAESSPSDLDAAVEFTQRLSAFMDRRDKTDPCRALLL